MSIVGQSIWDTKQDDAPLTYNFRTSPIWLRWVLERIAGLWYQRQTRARLNCFKAWAEAGSIEKTNCGVTTEMGYDVHITRKENWFDDGPEISLDEWKSFIDKDDAMRLDGYAEAKLPNGAALRVDSDGLAVWTAYRGSTAGGNMAWFDFRSGNVVVKNPDVSILSKMWQIAQKLGARVQGDDCEIYGSDGSVAAS